MKEYFMKKALHYARLAGKRGETPVGAVIVRNGEIVSWGYNTRETAKNAIRHAEITAIDRACKRLGGWRLWECEMYVTLEPCPMCAGAIINSRIRKVYFGAYDKKAGCFGSVTDMNALPFNHHPEVEGGVMQEECSEVLSEFFKKLRKERRKDADEQNN
ncbi:MAG: tRNA adenosine(34) deaminase TadA [Clostridia bacterium]|nr:tRNA adenosine(34) deaminase TadA [Clostridia bacterium]